MITLPAVCVALREGKCLVEEEARDEVALRDGKRLIAPGDLCDDEVRKQDEAGGNKESHGEDSARDNNLRGGGLMRLVHCRIAPLDS